MSKISSLAQLTAPAGGDLAVVVDVSDATMAPTGTDKKITLADLWAMRGMLYLTGGGTITATTITNAKSAGFQGMYLDPRFVWDATGLVINGISNFVIESAMVGSIGWVGNIAYNSIGYIKTDTTAHADGIQVYASSPATSPTQGIIFRNCVIVGSNSNATVHFGGGNRRCGLINSLVYNTSTATGAYAVRNDTALSDNNSENGIFDFGGGGGLAGGYGALGLGLGDQTQHTNDTLYQNLTTSAGTYGINAANSSNNLFTNYYDRSSPATATVLNAGLLTFIGGEDLNNTGLAHSVSGTTVLLNRLVSNGNCNVSGNLEFKGRCRCITTVALTSAGVLDISDPAGSWSSLTITGPAGAVVFRSGQYVPGGSPTVTGFSGTFHTSSWTTP